MPEFDATTALLPLPRRGFTVDLWDELMRVAGRVEHTDTRTLVRSHAYWLVPMMTTLVVCGAGLASPGLWTDEFATWGMARVPWQEFWPVLRYVDAVLAPYYVFMHGWVDLFGDSDAALRAPSLAAMSGSAALIAGLAARVSGRTAGLLAGLVFAVLPSTSRFAAEARPYALAVLAATAATWLLLRACERPTWARWAGYTAVIAVLGLLHVVGLLLLTAHLWVVLAWHRRMWWRLMLAGAVAAAFCVPLLVYGMRQRNQVAYISPVSLGSFSEYFGVLFGGAVVAFAVVAIAMFSLPLRHPAAVFTAWAVVPVLSLTVFSLALPMFLPRYLLYTAPGWALLAGVALARLRPRWAAAIVAMLALLALPTQLQIRRDDGHQQASHTFAGIVATHSLPGDAVVYADDEATGSWTCRDIVSHYVPGARRPADVLATNPQRHAGLLLATETSDIQGALAGVRRVWVLRLKQRPDPLAELGPAKEKVLREQFDVHYLWRSDGLTLALLQRKSG